MTALDWEFEYKAILQVPEYPEIPARWQETSAALRRTARAELDQPYGPGDRQRNDLFRAGQPGAPLVVFIHGGYWRMGSARITGSSPALNTAGIDVAVPSYSLCPAVTVMQIVGELWRRLAALWASSGTRTCPAGIRTRELQRRKIMSR